MSQIFSLPQRPAAAAGPAARRRGGAAGGPRLLQVKFRAYFRSETDFPRENDLLPSSPGSARSFTILHEIRGGTGGLQGPDSEHGTGFSGPTQNNQPPKKGRKGLKRQTYVLCGPFHQTGNSSEAVPAAVLRI